MLQTIAIVISSVLGIILGQVWLAYQLRKRRRKILDRLTSRWDELCTSKGRKKGYN